MIFQLVFQDMRDMRMAVFHFFNCPAVLVLLVHLVVFLIFFSLFLQLIIRQRIVDIYVGIKKKEFIVPT